MTRRLALSLSLSLLLAIVAGCKKPETDPGSNLPSGPEPAGNPVSAVPATPAIDSETTIDLSQYLVRGQMRVPAGAAVERRPGGVSLSGAQNFAIQIDSTDQPLT